MSIEIRHLHIEYPNHVLFEDVNLTASDDELIAIETSVLDGGTSLLKGIGGLLRGLGGEVIFDGVNILDNPPEAVLAKIGFVYEEAGLISLYTVFQNICLPLQFHSNLSDAGMATAVKETCALLGIQESLLGLRPHALNDVQTRLVNLARALVMEPRLLLIDELEGGMSDELLQATMATLRQRQHESPMTIIITTASDLVMSFADRVYRIENCGITEHDR